MITTVGTLEIDTLVNAARAAKRRRMNLNLHSSAEAAVQRLFIATEPDTYIRPHRHPEPHKWEMLLVLSGQLDLLHFDESGMVVDRVVLTPEGTRLVELSPGTWHSYVCRQSGTLVLEIKQGAYLPTAEQDFAPWAPPENSKGADQYLEWMRNAQPSAKPDLSAM
jgi:cupin fold WbuC family metalloprotein